uniref:hypothetical protein n=1 Tax=Haliangium sp. TaxID=2663208 RepID=UPI003D11890D
MTDLRDTAPQADGPDGAPSECSAPRRLLATATDRRLLPDEARVLDDWLAQAEGAVEQAAIAQRERDLAREERDRAQSDQALAEYDAKNERHRARTEHQWRQQSDQLCAELGKVLAQVAALVGAPGLEAEPEALLGRLAARLDQDSDSGRLLASV